MENIRVCHYRKVKSRFKKIVFYDVCEPNQKIPEKHQTRMSTVHRGGSLGSVKDRSEINFSLSWRHWEPLKSNSGNSEISFEFWKGPSREKIKDKPGDCTGSNCSNA